MRLGSYKINTLSFGLLIAISNVSNANILLSNLISSNLSFFFKKYKNKAAAIRLFPSIKEWFLTKKIKQIELLQNLQQFNLLATLLP